MTDSPLSLLAERLDPTPHPFLHDAAGYVKSKGGYLYSIQRRIADGLVVNRRVAVPSCFDSGKSFFASAAAGWWLDVHPVGSAFVVTTAPTNSQVRGILWREIGARHEGWGLPGRVTMDAQWKIGTRLVGFGKKPSDYSTATFQGIHDEYVLVIVDEAAGIPATLWDQIEGLITNDDARILVLGNPADPNSQFAKICKPGSGWHVEWISAFDTPNFTGEDVPDLLKRVLVSKTWVEEAAKRWGKESMLYTTKVLGQFPKVGKDTLIEPGWVLQAQQRELDPDILDAALGVDVARYGDDETVIYRREGGVVRLKHRGTKDSTMVTTGHVVQEANNTIAAPTTANVDDDGIGGAVVDRLGELGMPVVPIKNGGSPSQPLRFGNKRAEMYWQLREAFSGASGTGEDGTIDLDPADEDLASQLQELKYRVDSRGVIWVETKDEMRKRGLPSPDRADAACYAWVRGTPMALFTQQSTTPPKGLTDDLMTAQW